MVMPVLNKAGFFAADGTGWFVLLQQPDKVNKEEK